MRRRLFLSVVLVILAALPLLANAQAVTPPAPIEQIPWATVIGLAINAVGTLVIVKVLANEHVLPALRSRYPVLLPILAIGVGPLFGYVQSILSRATGIPIDLHVPIIVGLFSGGSAVAIAQISIQRQRQKARMAMAVPTPLLREHAPL